MTPALAHMLLLPSDVVRFVMWPYSMLCTTLSVAVNSRETSACVITMSPTIFLVLQDYAGIVEKSELAEKVKPAASQGPEGQASTVPVGYAFDPSSGKHKHVAFSLTCAYRLFRCVTYALHIGLSLVLT